MVKLKISLVYNKSFYLFSPPHPMFSLFFFCAIHKNSSDIIMWVILNIFSAMNRFRNLDKKATADSSTELKTKHQNTIT